MMMRMKINIDECDDVWCGVSVWVVGCAGSRQCCIQHRAAADGRHTPAVGLHTHTHVLIRIQSSTPICKHADSLMKYSVVTNTHYLSVCVWWLLFGKKMAKSAKEICSLFTTTSTLPSLHTLHITQCNDLCVGRLSSSLFAACCINEIFIFVLNFFFAISILEQSSTNFLVNSARKTQCNKHTVQ